MRWTSADPIGYADGMNDYLAEVANTINRVDWTGLTEVAPVPGEIYWVPQGGWRYRLLLKTDQR